MYVAHLSLHDFRSYATAEVALEPGVTSFIGRNGQGKTNLVEAIDYLSRLTSHRVATDAPLVRHGTEQAVVRAAVVKEGRTAVLEVELNPGRANRARVNKSALPRTRDLVGLVRTVIFSPEDLTLVKGDPSDRRRFLDDLVVLRTPRLAGTRADYDRVLKQRNSLLKTAGLARGSARDAALGDPRGLGRAARPARRRAARGPARPGRRPAALRRQGLRDGGPWGLARRRRDRVQVVGAPRAPARCRDPRARWNAAGRTSSTAASRWSARTATSCCSGSATAPMTRRRRGSRLPVKGYASHGESWSFALALRLASYDLLRSDGDDPILILDDVFAELDSERRAQLADLVAGAEQVLVTAAVPEDVPAALHGVRYVVADGEVTRDG